MEAANKKSGLNTAGKPLIEKQEKAKVSKKRFKPILLTNDDTAKQLFASHNSYTKKNQSGLKPNRTSRSIISIVS
jgi:hypothetical protein